MCIRDRCGPTLFIWTPKIVYVTSKFEIWTAFCSPTSNCSDHDLSLCRKHPRCDHDVFKRKQISIFDLLKCKGEDVDLSKMRLTLLVIFGRSDVKLKMHFLEERTWLPNLSISSTLKEKRLRGSRLLYDRVTERIECSGRHLISYERNLAVLIW